jgi:hypothetical protein
MELKNQISEIRAQLKQGDISNIAELTEFTRVSVSRMFSPNNPQEMHPLVLETAKKIIDSRRKKIEESIAQ